MKWIFPKKMKSSFRQTGRVNKKTQKKIIRGRLNEKSKSSVSKKKCN